MSLRKFVGNKCVAELNLSDRSREQVKSMFHSPGSGPRIRLQASKVGEVKIWEIILVYKYGPDESEGEEVFDQVPVQTPKGIVLKKNAKIDVTCFKFGPYEPVWEKVLVPMTNGFLWISYMLTNDDIRSGRIKACYVDTLGEGLVEEGEVM